MPMTDEDDLRPLERRVLRMQAEGQDDAEDTRSASTAVPSTSAGVADLARRSHATRQPSRQTAANTRSCARSNVGCWRGETRERHPKTFAPKFKHSPGHMARVEDLARYKLRRSND